MRIERIETFATTIPYKSAYSISLGTTEKAKHVLVRIRVDEGPAGVGETALIMPDVTGETQESIVSTIHTYFAPLLIGEDPFNVERIMNRLDGVALGKFAFPYAKAAIDCALYDLIGKALNVPVWTLLGGKLRDQFTVSRSLPVSSPEDMADRAVGLKGEGYRMLTIKVGFDAAEDLERVKAVRKAVGDEYPLEVDVNQAYDVPTAVRTLRRMEDFGILNAEQPCPWWDIDGMAEVRSRTNLSIIADESVKNLSDALKVVKARAADAICLKLVKNGGYYWARKIAAVAEAAGLYCTMGSRHPFGVGTAAILHFVAAVGIVREPIGYGVPSERFVDDILSSNLTFGDGVVRVPEGPGLGVEVDEEKLRHYSSTLSYP